MLFRSPAKSPGFDKDWAANGYIDTVLRNAAQWVEAQKVEGLSLEIIRLPGRTPVLFFDIPATKAQSSQTVLMYGHMDKQPEFTGWRNDLGPWTPKYEDGKLFGRGGADDGYAVYASIAAVQALKAQKVPHPRIVGIVETCEESGSYDLLPYVDFDMARARNFATKLNLALAAGIALPLLAWLGYVPGAQDANGLAMLTAAYCLLPCALKAMAMGGLQFFIIQPDAKAHTP